jgi:ElaB/YqjD/DUF883 family membrane-anchored ribosome-binding protein
MDKLVDEVTRAQLIRDFKVVVDDAEALLKVTANHSGEKLAEIRARTEQSLKTVKDGLVETEMRIIAKSKEAVKVTDEYVHQNPWQSVGASAAIGMIIGLLIGRR